MNNAFITSSDHHAHFDCLEEIFKTAKEKEIPFVCGGDIIGDYNFENIVHLLGYRMPNEIPSLILQRDMEKDDIQTYSEYQRLLQFGSTAQSVIEKISSHQPLANLKTYLDSLRCGKVCLSCVCLW